MKEADDIKEIWLFTTVDEGGSETVMMGATQRPDGEWLSVPLIATNPRALAVYEEQAAVIAKKFKAKVSVLHLNLVERRMLGDDRGS